MITPIRRIVTGHDPSGILRPGDICIQRGTTHLWRAMGDGPCRIAFIQTDARPYEFGGQPLPEVKP